jgi:hypothetical protein
MSRKYLEGGFAQLRVYRRSLDAKRLQDFLAPLQSYVLLGVLDPVTAHVDEVLSAEDGHLLGVLTLAAEGLTAEVVTQGRCAGHARVPPVSWSRGEAIDSPQR